MSTSTELSTLGREEASKLRQCPDLSDMEITHLLTCPVSCVRKSRTHQKGYGCLLWAGAIVDVRSWGRWSVEEDKFRAQVCLPETAVWSVGARAMSGAR